MDDDDDDDDDDDEINAQNTECLLIFHSKNGCTNAPRCLPTHCTTSVLFLTITDVLNGAIIGEWSEVKS